MNKYIKHTINISVSVGITFLMLKLCGDTREAACALAGMITLYMLMRDE